MKHDAVLNLGPIGVHVIVTALRIALAAQVFDGLDMEAAQDVLHKLEADT